MRHILLTLLLAFTSITWITGCPAKLPQEQADTEQVQDSTKPDTAADAASPEPRAEPVIEAAKEPAAPDARPEPAKPDVQEATPERVQPPEPTPEPTPEPRPEATPEATPEPTPGDSSNKTCSFNSDCPTAERCECDENTGCFCKIGKRGTGKNGVDVCKSGNECESALCIEGNGGTYYCSGECKSDTDCKEKLPVCAQISFVGQVCIRKKP